MRVWVELSLVLFASALGAGSSYALLRSRRKPLDQVVARAAGLPRYADALLIALVVAYALIFSALSALSHFSFNNAGYDLAIFDQAVWSSLCGRLLENTILPDARLLIGQRFSPILLAFVPLYAVWSDPTVLTTVQTLGIALGAFPLYWFARRRIGYALGLVIVASYLVFPAVQYANLFEFHEVVLAIPLLSFAAFFLLREKYAPLLVCLGLTLLVKEEMAFVVSMFGLYAMVFTRQRWLGFGLTMFGMIWAFVLLQYALPFFRGTEGQGYYYFGHGTLGGAHERYGYLGSSLDEIVVTLVTRPLYVLQHILIPPKIEFVLLLLVPLALLPLLGPEIATLTLPTLAICVLSDLHLNYSIRYHYTAALLPFLFYATVVGVERILRWRTRSGDARRARGIAVGTMLLVAGALGYYLYAPGPLARNFDASRYALDANTAAGHTLLQTIPADAIVATQTELLPHLAERRSVYEFTVPQFPWQVEYAVAKTTGTWFPRYKPFWDKYLDSGYLGIVAQSGSFLLARRLSPAQTPQIEFDKRIVLSRVAVVASASPRGGQPIYIPVEWYAQKDVHNHYIVQMHLTDAQGHIWARDDREPCYAFCPTSRWRFGQFVTDYYILQVPPTAPSGDYKITAALYDPANSRRADARDAVGRSLDEIVIGTIHITKDKSSVTASQLSIEQPLFVDMREMRFLGYVPPRATITPGELLQVGLYWRARGKPQGDYVVAVQLRDAAGHVAFEHASRPANGTYPTTAWDAGEVLLDWHDFTLPNDLAAGEYAIYVLLRDADNSTLGEVRLITISVVK